MWSSIIDLFFPKLCFCCKKTLDDFEEGICLNCRYDLPVTEFHHFKKNEVEQLLYGRLNIERATSLLYFYKKGIVQNLMHNLKYRGVENISTLLGKWMGEELSNLEDFKDIDLVVPVPLHKKRLQKRGYNQVEKFSKEIAFALNAKYRDDVLFKKSGTSTQVFKDSLKRWTDIQGSFQLNKNIKGLEGKHILLTDDIITTGSTIETCGTLLLQIKNVKLSVATMALSPL